MFKKGDRVKIVLKDGTKHGTVIRGGANTTTAILDGGEYKVKSHPSRFQKSDLALLKDKEHPLSSYSVISYRELQDGHGDSRTFTAKICKDGKVFGLVRNNGWGGCNEYIPKDFTSTTCNKIYKQFFEDCKKCLAQFGYPDMIEAVDSWVEWYQHKRPYNVLFETYVQEIKKKIDAFKKKYSEKNKEIFL